MKQNLKSAHEHGPHCVQCADHIAALETRITALENCLEQAIRSTNADKRRVVEEALRDPERTELSDREIARQCGVTHGFVLKMRKLLGLPRAPGGPRLVTRGGTTYQMQTGRINATRKVQKHGKKK